MSLLLAVVLLVGMVFVGGKSMKLNLGVVALGTTGIVALVVVLSLSAVRSMVAQIPVVGGLISQAAGVTGGLLGMLPVVGNYFK